MVQELKATTWQQTCQAAQAVSATTPDPQVSVLISQVTSFCTKLDVLRTSLLQSVSSSTHENDVGCCPGLPNHPRIQCAQALEVLASDLAELSDKVDGLDEDLLEMSGLTQELGSRLDPLSSRLDELTSQLEAVIASGSNQRMRDNNLRDLLCAIYSPLSNSLIERESCPPLLSKVGTQGDGFNVTGSPLETK